MVATGDLVVAPAPYATASFMSEWPGTLQKLTAIEATTIVPGHGPLLHDWSWLTPDCRRGPDDHVSRDKAVRTV